jgi:multiple sugar transport system permease protein
LHFLDYLRNSLIVSSVSALFAVAIASFAAFSITRVPTPGARVVLLLTLSVSMFPQISVVGYLFRLMRGWGWINTYPALITPYIAWTLPLMMWILVSFFSKIPHQLDKAAMIDGASPLYIFYKIILPLSAPALFSAFLLAFIFAFNEFMFALILTLNHHARTLPVGIALFEGLHGQMPWPQIMAASTLAVVPLLLLTIFFQRYIIGGLTKGAVKG